MEEVVVKTGMKVIADMKLDNCQASVNEKE
jgi:hypothetical protein